MLLAAIWAALGGTQAAWPAEPVFLAQPTSGSLFNALYRPDGAGPFPAMVVLHTCGGLAQHELDWGNRLKSWGYVAAVVDSFRPRGEKFICGNWRVTVDQMASDAFAALDRLRAMPFVDPDKIGVIGFSYGAAAAVRLTSRGYDQAHHPDKSNFRAAVAYYVRCTVGQDGAPERDDNLRDDLVTPLQLVLGEKDTDTPIATCTDKATQLVQTGKPVETRVIPGATHAFDNPANSGKGFSPRPGVLYLYNAEAANQAAALTRTFLAQALGGKP